MGTYTTNKNLFMPTVGEQGWGTLVNNNFSTIDNFLKPITVSGSTYTFTGNHVGNQSGGSVSATSITNSGTLTQTGTSTFTGKITANGGIGTTSLTTSSTITSTGLITANGGMKGKINISSVGTNSNNVKIASLTSSQQNGECKSNASITISASQVSLSRINTSILNCTLTDTQLKTNANATCTVTITCSKVTSSGNVTLNVIRTSDSTTILNETKSHSAGTVNLSWTFTRNLNQSYKITLPYMEGNGAYGAATVKTNVVTFYVS